MYNDLDFMLFDALRRTNKTMRAHRPRCEGEDGGKTAAKREIILAIISDNNGGMRQNQLASAFRVSPSTLSEMLNRLEEDGLIERHADPIDRRATLLKLTERGFERAGAIKDEVQKQFAETFGALNDGEKQQLITLLHKISG